MKKRIITLLAILALLVVCAAFAVSATVDTSGDWTCPCCGKAYSEITWITYGSDTSYGFAKKNDDGRHYLVTSNYNGNLGGNLPLDGSVTDSVVILFGKSSGDLVFGAAKSKRLFDLKNNVTAYLIGDGKSTLFSAGYSDSSAHGGVISVAAGSELHMTNLKVTMQLGSGASGQITTLGGAKSGGLIMNAGTTTLTNCTLNASSVVSTGYGGAIYNEGTMTVTGGSITGGVSNQGGAIYNVATMTLTNVAVSGGNASGEGGTIAMNNLNAVTTIDGTSEVTGGVTAKRGATIYLSKGTLNIGGSAVINAATAKASAAMYRGIYMISSDGTCNLYGDAVVKSGNQGNGDAIGLMYGTLTLSGNASVVNETEAYNDCIYRYDQGTGVIEVDRRWTGNATVAWPGVDLEEHGKFFASDGILWGAVDADFTFTANTEAESGAASGLRLEKADHSYPPLYYFNSQEYGNGFVTPRAQVIAGDDATWYLTLADAVYGYIDNEADTKYIKMWTSSGVTLNNTFYIDFNGYNSTATKGEKGKIYAFDSTAKAGKEGVTLKFDAEPITVFGGKTYICTNKTIYPVEMKINQVVLRANENHASMYYTAAITAHQNAGITEWGMAVALKDSSVLNEHLYTIESAAKESSLSNFNSVLVQGVVKNGEADNADRAGQAIFAKAYIKVGNTVVMSNAVDYSLRELIEEARMDENNATAFETIATREWYQDIFGTTEA